MPTVAGIMCVWEEHRMAPLAVESISNFVDELIVVDNDSQDGTREAIRQACDRFDVPHSIHNRPDLRLRHARLWAFEQTSCDYCLICDGDEVYHTDGPNSIENLREEMNPETVIKSPMRYLYLDLEHTHLNRVELPAHKSLYPNTDAVSQMPEQRDLPRFNGGAKSLSYPLKFNCGVKDWARIYLREQHWYSWSKEVETDKTIREFAQERIDGSIAELASAHIEEKWPADHVVEYDPEEYGYYPEVIRKAINRGDIRGYESAG